MIKNFRDKFLNIKEGIKGNIQDTFGTRIIEKILQDGSVYEGEISVSGVKVGQGIMIFPKEMFTWVAGEKTNSTEKEFTFSPTANATKGTWSTTRSRAKERSTT